MSRGYEAVRGTSFALAFAILTTLAGTAAAASGPEGAGDLDTILQQLETFAVEMKVAQGVPGMAYAVVKGNQVVYARGFGYKDKDASSGLVDERTLFEIGSCTKAFNAATLGTVVDEGKVAWTDKVRDHLPDFKMFDPWVTREFLVQDLMAQRSGMPGYALDFMSLVGFGRKDIMRAIRFVEPSTSFRDSFGYQNNLHLWAAELIEKKTGLAWEEAVRQRILAPLGMSESTFDFATYDASPNHALGHSPVGTDLWTVPPDWPYRGWVATYAPAGGLCSNVTDMAKWVAMQLGNGSYGGTVILKPHTLQLIRAPRVHTWTDSSGVASYAMGWVFMSSPKTPWYMHDGETPGMHSIVAIYPECDLGLVVLTNSSLNKVPECMAFRLLELYFGTEHLECPRTGVAGLFTSRSGAREAHAAPDSTLALPLGKLVGTYENVAYGKAVIRREGGGIAMIVGPAKRHGVLTSKGGNTYDFAWDAWPGQHSTVVFKADAAGEVHKLTIPELSDVRGGDFKRTD